MCIRDRCYKGSAVDFETITKWINRFDGTAENLIDFLKEISNEENKEQQARSGQPISLMDLADAVHREEREKKKSVVDQLKSQPKAEHKKTAPKKSAEREI